MPYPTFVHKVNFFLSPTNSFHEMIYFFHFFPYFKYFLFTSTNPSSIYILNDKNRAHDEYTKLQKRILRTQILIHVVTLVIMTVNEYIIKWDGVITQVSQNFDAYHIALSTSSLPFIFELYVFFPCKRFPIFNHFDNYCLYL